MAAVEVYTAAVGAVAAQRGRVLALVRDARERGNEVEKMAGMAAQGSAADPGPELDPELTVLESYLEHSDVLIDVGGGSGRLGLPLARRCREVINVEPSRDTRAAFTTAAAVTKVTNIRTVPHDWLGAPSGVVGDVVLAAHVTYAVRDIVSFVDRLQTAAQRRVLILLYAAPAQAMPLHQHVHRLLCNEAAELPPSYRELLPVLWEMGLLPDVRVIPEVGLRPTAPTVEAAITRTLQSFGAVVGTPGLDQDPWASRILRAHANELYRAVDSGGYRPASDGEEDHRGVLVTWEPHHNR